MDTGATCGVPRVQSVEEKLHPISLSSTTTTTLTQHYDLVRHCIAARREDVTPHHISTTMPAEVWPDVSHAHRLRVFDTLVEAGHWKLLKRRGKMMKPYVPVIAVKFCLSSVLPAVPSDVLDIPLQEVVRVSAFKDSEETLKDTINKTTFLTCLDRLAAPPRRSSLPGAESLYAREEREMWERKARKVRAHMAAWSKLKGMGDPPHLAVWLMSFSRRDVAPSSIGCSTRTRYTVWEDDMRHLQEFSTCPDVRVWRCFLTTCKTGTSRDGVPW